MINGFRFMFNGGYLFGGLFVLILIAAVITLLILLLTKKSPNHQYIPNPPKNNPALDALKLRFANGEIAEEEYLRRKEMLTKD